MQKASWSGRFRLALLSMCATGAIAVPGAAYAQDAAPAAQSSFVFNIPSQPLAKSLNQIAERSNIQVIYPDKEPADIVAPAASGTMTVAQALATALAGSPYTFSFVRPGVVTLVRADGEGASGERVLGAVRVQGAQGGGSLLTGSTPVNGINGSRDVTATEGTGSYTSNALTVGSKTAQSIKDTPMAVSVITSQRMQDQNITDLNSAMRDAPGITVLHDSANDLNFYSRGFQITQMQIDGGAAQNFMGNTSFYRPIIDMSLYDHVEIVRGATGTFNAYGDPGGVLNLVRKRPLDHAQMLLDMQLGSWDWHRFSVDVTGPLAWGGKLRARLIATHQDNGYFYDVAKASRNVVSGTLELDVTPTTMVTVGANYQEQKDVPWRSGLMRYLTGKAVPFARSTCLCFPWANNDRQNVEMFGQVEQNIGRNWNLTLKATRIRQRSYSEDAQVSGVIDPATGIGAGVKALEGDRGRAKQSLFEVTLNGSFQLFGQSQRIIIGANYSMFDPTGSTIMLSSSGILFTNGATNGAKIGDIAKFDPNTWTPTAEMYSEEAIGWDYADYRYLNAYATLELTPVKRLHVISAIRYSGYRNRSQYYYLCTSRQIAEAGPGNAWCLGKSVGDKFYDENAYGQISKGGGVSWPPSVQFKYDITDDLTGYGAYTDIYIDRSSYKTSSGVPLPPTTGQNFEGGLKWLSSNKKTNVTFSGYYTKQINTDQIADPWRNDSTTVPGQLNEQIYCCYKNVDGAYNLSYGIDVEMTGEISRNWQVSASYTYNFNKAKRPGWVYFDGSDQALVSQAPRHLFKLWSSYEFDDRSSMNGLRLGLGVNARSKTFVADSYCPQDPISTPSGPQCPVSRVPVFFSDPGYVVFSGSVGYKINDKLRVDAELENLLDKTYYEQVGSLGGGNWYGSPRSVKVTLRGKF